MTQQDIAHRIDELTIDAAKIDSLQKVLYEVIYQKELFAVEDCEWAFALLGDLTFKAKNDLTDLSDAAFENLRESGTGS